MARTKWQVLAIGSKHQNIFAESLAIVSLSKTPQTDTTRLTPFSGA